MIRLRRKAPPPPPPETPTDRVLDRLETVTARLEALVGPPPPPPPG